MAEDARVPERKPTVFEKQWALRHDGPPMYDDGVRRFCEAQVAYPERMYLMPTTGPLWHVLNDSNASNADRVHAVERALVECWRAARGF